MANFDFSIAVRFDGSAVYISEMDLPLFLGGRWYVNNRYMKEWKSNRIFHRAVMGDPDGMLVDHDRSMKNTV